MVLREEDSDESSAGVYDESDFDVETIEEWRDARDKKVFVNLVHFETISPSMTFKDIAEARKVVNFYSMSNGFGLKVVKSDKSRVRYMCQEGCHFILYIAKDGKGAGVRVKILNLKHKCLTAYFNPRANYSLLAYYFKSRVQNNPQYRLKDLRLEAENELKLNVSEHKIKAAKRFILTMLEGSFIDGFKNLEAYAQELRDSNPSSKIIVNISSDELKNGRRVFMRMFVCFRALQQGFRHRCRPLIGLDETFLFGKCKGQLLAAVSQDNMNKIYPIAWAVVDKETSRNWSWFVQHLFDALNLDQGAGIIFMYDMQKNILPEARHKFCVRHIESNWCQRWKEGELKKLLWWCAWCTDEEEFKDMLKEMDKVSKEAARDLLRYPPQTWCRAYFTTTCKNDMVDNNITESFNSWIKEPRHKSIIRMLEEIRVMVMNRLREEEEEEKVKHWPHEWSPGCMFRFRDYMGIAQGCKIEFNGDAGYERLDISVDPELDMVSVDAHGKKRPRQSSYGDKHPNDDISYDTDPQLKHHIPCERKFRIAMRMKFQKPIGTRKNYFVGDHIGASKPIYLLYSSSKLKFRGDANVVAAPSTINEGPDVPTTMAEEAVDSADVPITTIVENDAYACFIEMMNEDFF
ncbi:hypothetical protein Cni_G07152 [Canna indica]|uniref:MULE transposase domain-containing protein n=1 Tax=Canna indica TaxID=4628 RepID=A0AAQ3Q6M7_9LILI|nr:hypothetical protein Cni_G07152 [Canna indica]